MCLSTNDLKPPALILKWMKKIHDNIRAIRSLKNYSQEHMAESLGISQSSYGKLERGHTQITWNKLKKLSTIFSTSVWNIVHFNESYPAHLQSGEEKPETEGSVSASEVHALKEHITHLQQLNDLLEQQVNDKMEIIRLLNKTP